MTSTIDTQIDREQLKCSLCGMYFELENEDETDDYYSIDETGKCVGCQSEYGDAWPDRAY